VDSNGTSPVLFDTEEDAEAASEALGGGSSPQPGVTVVRREVREVVALALTEDHRCSVSRHRAGTGVDGSPGDGSASSPLRASAISPR
jgi:hypothetical protein